MSVVTEHPADLQVISIRTESENFSGEDTTVTWTVNNLGDAVWAGTKSWNDAVYISKDPAFIPERATFLGIFEHSNIQGLAAGGSYTTSTKVKLPPGTNGSYYIYVITDNQDNPEDARNRKAKGESLSGTNTNALNFYAGGIINGYYRAGTAYEASRDRKSVV